MRRYACLNQEGQSVQRAQEMLAEGLRRIGRESFGDDPSAGDIACLVMKRGFAWTAGEPSTSSIVIRCVPIGLSLDQREAFMRKVCDLWTTVTGCSIDEIAVTACDGPLPI